MKLLDEKLSRFLPYVKPYRWYIAGATFCGLLKFNLPVLFPWLLKDLIDYLVTTPTIATARIHWTMAGLLVVYLLWTVASYFRSYLADTASQRLTFDIRNDLFSHLQRMSLGFYEQRQAGAVASRLIGDVSMAQNMVGAAFTNAVMDLSSLALITGLLFWVNWQLALVSLSVLPLYVVFNRHYKQKIKHVSRQAQDKLEEITGNVNEKIGGVAIVQSYTGEKREERYFFQDTRTNLGYLLENVRNNAMANAIVGFLTTAAPVVVVWFGAVEVANNQLTVGGLVAFYAYLGMFYQPLNRLSELNMLIANSRAALDRIYEVFSMAPEIVDDPAGIDVGRVRGEVTFRDVCFAYDDRRRVLSDINLNIRAGRTIALVGASGAGKSTFVKLIPRFYDVTSGEVTIDGVDVRRYKLKALRRQVAFVLQEPILFSGTIAANIAYSRPQASRSEIEEAAKAANAHEFIMNAPQGYDSEIGERGIRLSGGQKQRLALARAFLKDAPILILDEATSSLDSESEKEITRALKRLMDGRTTFVIAHRLSTIQNADEIVVFSDGRIAEIGTHRQLMAQSGGIYRRLYDTQFAPAAE